MWFWKMTSFITLTLPLNFFFFGNVKKKGLSLGFAHFKTKKEKINLKNPAYGRHGAKGRLNGTTKVNTHTNTHTHKQTYGQINL